MKKTFFVTMTLFLLLFSVTSCDNGTVVEYVSTIGFETISVDESGSKNQTSFTEDGLVFENNYNAAWNSWKGFACSTLTDTVTSGYTNGLSSAAGKAYLGTKFAVVYEDSAVCQFMNNAEYKIKGLYLTNATYTYLDIKNGSDFSKKFEEGDWFKVIIKGYSATHVLIGTREFYLADFRAGKTEILNSWKFVSLAETIPGKVQRLEFQFDSSDRGDWGVNTPKYVCVDNLLVVK